LFSYTD
jgi:CspA family cold shock protein